MNLDGIIEDYPNTTLPLNKATFTNLANAILDKICPVGKTEIFYDNEDHSDYLGFTWERTSVGRTLVGIDTTQTEFDTVGKTGGSKTHTLTQAQIPKIQLELSVAGGGSRNASALNYTPVSNGRWYAGADDMIKSFGGDQAHNNLQPYEVFAIWKRVA